VVKKETITHHSRGVQEFLARHGKDVTGVVHGFDRLRLQGSLRALYQPEIMSAYLRRAGVRWKDFKGYVCEVTGRIRAAAETIAGQAGARVRQDNGLPWIEDVPKAQALLDRQVGQSWPKILDPLIQRYHPTLRELQRVMALAYYWTVTESEYATDVMFRDRTALQRIYPALVHHSIMSFGTGQVLRFFGRKQAGSAVEVKTTRRQREEGVCVKHWLNRNAQKAYDKGSILRCEGTMNEPADFRVWRKAEGRGQATKAWRQLRRTVADMPRRAEVMRAWGDRQLAAFAAVHHGEPLATSAASVCRPVVRKGRRHRALHPFGCADAALLAAVNRGEFAIGGLRNADVRALLYPSPPAGTSPRQLASRVSRQLSLLRAHGLIARLGRSHRYKVTRKGRTIITAFLAAARADTEQLTKLAA
jgi:hypothetical protein